MKKTITVLTLVLCSAAAFAHDNGKSQPSQPSNNHGSPSSGAQSAGQYDSQGQSQGQGQNQGQNQGQGQSQSSSSRSNSNSDSNSASKSSSNSGASATGGSVKDSGNSASISGSESGVKNSGNSNSSSKSGVKDSGNSSNLNANQNNTKSGVSKSGNSTNTVGVSTGAQTNSSANTVSNGSATSGNAQSTTTETTYKEVRQAPTAYAPDALPSAPCRVSGSVGASSPFGGISAGGSKLDDECDRRETARAFALLGNKMAAARILCNTKAAKEAQLTFQECADYATGYLGGVQDGDAPRFTVPAGKGTPKQ